MYCYRSFNNLDNWYALGLGQSFDPHAGAGLHADEHLIGSPFSHRAGGSYDERFHSAGL